MFSWVMGVMDTSNPRKWIQESEAAALAQKGINRYQRIENENKEMQSS